MKAPTVTSIYARDDTPLNIVWFHPSPFRTPGLGHWISDIGEESVGLAEVRIIDRHPDAGHITVELMVEPAKGQMKIITFECERSLE